MESIVDYLRDARDKYLRMATYALVTEISIVYLAKADALCDVLKWLGEERVGETTAEILIPEPLDIVLRVDNE